MPIAVKLIVSFLFWMMVGIAGAPDFLKRYSEKAAAAGVDPLGFAWGPFAYGGGQVLAQAVT